MTSVRLLITAMVVENRPVREVAATYDVSTSWLYELLARYRREGDAVFEPRSRRPASNPNAIPLEVVDLDGLKTIAESLRRWLVGAVGRLVDGQRPLHLAACPRQIPQVLEHAAEVDADGSDRGMVRVVGRLTHGQRPLELAAGPRQIPKASEHAAEVDADGGDKCPATDSASDRSPDPPTDPAHLQGSRTSSPLTRRRA